MRTDRLNVLVRLAAVLTETAANRSIRSMTRATSTAPHYRLFLPVTECLLYVTDSSDANVAKAIPNHANHLISTIWYVDVLQPTIHLPGTRTRSARSRFARHPRRRFEAHRRLSVGYNTSSYRKCRFVETTSPTAKDGVP
ncbi:MAG: hypothetical protein D6741_21605 [Planctomycetota bacterium]|nr:MAG: hypothetical protein D6741_21605 [Planctomycetota bacterium]